MDILFYEEKNYVSTIRTAEVLLVSMPQINCYIKKERWILVRVDNIKLIELDSLMLLNDYLFYQKKQLIQKMHLINVFISCNKISKEIAATTNQIKHQRALCVDRKIEFPFSSLQECKKYLKKYEASKAINEIL